MKKQKEESISGREKREVGRADFRVFSSGSKTAPPRPRRLKRLNERRKHRNPGERPPRGRRETVSRETERGPSFHPSYEKGGFGRASVQGKDRHCSPERMGRGCSAIKNSKKKDRSAYWLVNWTGARKAPVEERFVRYKANWRGGGSCGSAPAAGSASRSGAGGAIQLEKDELRRKVSYQCGWKTTPKHGIRNPRAPPTAATGSGKKRKGGGEVP